MPTDAQRMRERIATAVAGDIWTQYQNDGTAKDCDTWRDAVAYEAVRLADALISKLEQRGRLLPTDEQRMREQFEAARVNGPQGQFEAWLEESPDVWQWFDFDEERWERGHGYHDPALNLAYTAFVAREAEVQALKSALTGLRDMAQLCIDRNVINPTEHYAEGFLLAEALDAAETALAGGETGETE